MTTYTIFTERLGLRQWKPSDIDPYSAMNADEEVMAYFPKTWSREESLASYQRLSAHFEVHGYTYFAADLLAEGRFIGFIGLMHQNYPSPFTPFVDIGWRLQKSVWGMGLATEGAKACLKFAFEEMGLREVLSVAPGLNTRSHKVMQKIEMKKAGEFEHPAIEASSPLKHCHVYRTTRDDSQSQ